MTDDRRLNRLESATGGPDGTYERCFQAIEADRWTWRDIYVLLDGEDQLSTLCRELMDWAIEARARRQAGEPPVLGDPFNLAAEIASYLPDEEVPRKLSQLIDKHAASLGGSRRTSLTFLYGIHGAATKLVMRTSDAMQIRRDLWGTNASVDRDDKSRQNSPDGVTESARFVPTGRIVTQ